MKRKLDRIQYRIWLDSEFQNSKNTYNLCSSIKIEGVFYPDLLRAGLVRCFCEYDILHSTISLDNEGYPFWSVKQKYDIPFTYVEADNATDDELKTAICQQVSVPINLQDVFPCRFCLYRQSSQTHIFAATFHHCMMDGYGMMKFFEYLSQVYDQLAKGQELHVKAPVFHEYDDVLDSYTVSDLRKEGISEICKYLKGTPFTIRLPLIANVTRQHTDPLTFQLGATLLQKCKQFCQDHHHTMFRLFAACWGTVLCRILNTERIVIDHGVNLRKENEKDTTGIRINNQPLLIDISSGVTATGLLEAIRNGRQLLRKYDFIDYIDLISELRKTAPELYSTVPNLVLNYPRPLKLVDFNVESCVSTHFYTPILNSPETIGLHIFDDDEGQCQITYHDSIPVEVIEELSLSFQTVLSQMVSEDKPVNDYELVTQERVQAIISQNEVRPFDIEETLFQQITHHASSHPDKIAVTCHSESLSYEQFERLTDVIANNLHAFRNNSGCDQSTTFRVAIYMERGLYTIPLIIGALKAGATYIPIDAKTPQERIEYILQDSGAQFVISDLDTEFTTQHCQYITINQLLHPAKSCILPYQGNNTAPSSDLPQTAYIIYTSGTTGKPKATPISSKSLHQLIHNILFHNRWIDSDDVVLQMASISFDASVVDIFSTLYAGATLVIATEQERKDVRLLLNLLQRERISFATIPPSVMSILPAQPLPAMKTMVFAGEATPKKVFDRWRGKGIRLVNAYGPTENAVCSTFADIEENTSPTNIGRPLSNVSCYVLDRYRHLLPFGIPGELYLGGNQLTEGYLGHHELNAARFFKNPYATERQTQEGVNQVIYKTGDMACLRPDYSIEFMGRMDFQVKLNGYRIELEGIECRLRMHPSVSQAVCTLETTGNDTKQLVAYVQAKDLDKTTGSRQLQAWLTSALPAYMIPGKWIFVDDFKLTPNGKVDRKRLPKPEDAISQCSQTDFTAPETASEHLLAEIFAKILTVEKVSVNANLFEEYGLDSVQVMTAVYEANHQGIELSVSAFMKNKSIRNSLRNNNIYPYYWINGQDTQKPVLILVCGLVYLHPHHDALLELLGDKYSILVLDSIHEFFFKKEKCTLRSLLDHYMTVLPEMLKGRSVFGITGWCIGGEIALQLAVELKQAHVASPIVFSLDGYLHLDIDKNAPLFAMNFPNLSEAINRERDRIKNEFISSAFFRPYDGTVYCFFADEFSKYPPNGEILSDEEVEFNYRSFKENPSLWKKMQPNCIVQFLHDNHYTFLQRKNMEEVIKVMSAHTSPDGKLTPDDFPAAKNSITGVSVRYAPDPDKHWYVFRVSYGREDKASNFMVDDGTYTYIAKKIVEKYVGGKRKRYLQILIPNLLFAYTTKEKAEEYARNTPALSYLSYYYNHFALDANQKNPPLTVSDKEMNQFIHATSNMDKHLLFVQPSQCHFKEGELVRVIDGRFAGVEGRVARVAGQQRVVISLSNIGLISTAYIPTAFIKPIDTI